MGSLDWTTWQKPDRGAVFAISGPSGVGKTTLVKEALLVVPHLTWSVSATTRPPRVGEVDGRDYHFVSRERFAELLAARAFLEHADVYGNSYGTLRAPVEEAVARGESVLLDIDVQGARQVRASLSGVITIFIIPPTPELLVERLRQRGTDSKPVIARRIREARLQLEACDEFDYLVMNDHLPQAHQNLQAILAAILLQRNRRDTWVAWMQRRLGSDD